MTVAQLIAHLLTLPQDAVVVVAGDDPDMSLSAGDVTDDGEGRVVIWSEAAEDDDDEEEGD